MSSDVLHEMQSDPTNITFSLDFNHFWCLEIRCFKKKTFLKRQVSSGRAPERIFLVRSGTRRKEL